MRLTLGVAIPFAWMGDGSCPPEDCGGVPGFLARRRAWTALETSRDFAVLADFVDQLVLKRNTGASIDAEEVDQVQEALELPDGSIVVSDDAGGRIWKLLVKILVMRNYLAG